MNLSCLLIFFFNVLTLITAHGRLREPAARSTAWRVDSSYPAYYNDHEMFCGGAGVQWNTNGGKCSICGESYTANPKLFEKGGEYYTGRSIRTYKKGQTIDVHVELTANHLGWFEFRICNIDGNPSDATQECLDKTLLKDANGLTRFPVQGGIRDFNYQIVLPQDLVCNQCVFQWKYHCGNTWGIDPETGKGCTGCSPEQEEFYGCSDVSITSDGSITPRPLTSGISTSALPITTKPSIWTESVPTNVQSLTGKCPQGDGIYPELNSFCKKYYLCNYSGTNYETIQYFTCGDSLLFDEQKKTCDWSHLVSCNQIEDKTLVTDSTTTDYPKTTDNDVKCKQGDGLYADLNSDCENYYQCLFSGTRFEKIINYSCPGGLRFDPISKICNWANQVECNF